MRRWEAWLFQSAAAAVTISGVLYFWLKYLLRTDDPFAVVNHPLEPTALKIHILAAPVVVLSAGVLLRSHVLTKLATADRKNRRTGVATLVLLGPMIVSGYALEVAGAGAPAARIAHLATGTAFAAVYIVHQAVSRRLVRAERRQRRRIAA